MKSAAQPIRCRAPFRSRSTSANSIIRSTGKTGTCRERRTMSPTSSRWPSSGRTVILSPFSAISLFSNKGAGQHIWGTHRPTTPSCLKLLAGTLYHQLAS